MLIKVFNRIRYGEEGASLVEYALLVLLIAMAAFIATQLFGQALSDTYTDISDELLNANGG